MSTTTVMSVWPGERAESLEQLSNSHGSAPVVWNAMAMRYLGLPSFGYSLRIEELWPLYTREDLPAHHRAVLLMTYDDALIMQKDYKRAAFNIRRFLHDFPPAHGYANHWGRIATLVDNAPSPAIGFWMTSVANNPFEGEWNEEAEGTDPPDWGKYWDVYVMVEKHERQQDAGTSGG